LLEQIFTYNLLFLLSIFLIHHVQNQGF